MQPLTDCHNNNNRIITIAQKKTKTFYFCVKWWLDIEKKEINKNPSPRPP